MGSRIAYICCLLMLLVGCSQRDYSAEIKQLVDDNKIRNAKVLYKEWVEKERNPNIEREYIQFLFDHKQYRDFDNTAKDYLSRYPQDSEVKNLRFDYYALLAGASEREGRYGDALFYITQHLLSPDYRDYRRWESRQGTVLKKWYEYAEKDDDPAERRKVLVQMRNLGFDNLAKSLNPELYAELESASKEGE